MGLTGVTDLWIPKDSTPLPLGAPKGLLWQAHLCWSQILIESTFPDYVARLPCIDSPKMVIEVLKGLGLAFLWGDQFPVRDFVAWVNKRVGLSPLLLNPPCHTKLYHFLCRPPAWFGIRLSPTD